MFDVFSDEAAVRDFVGRDATLARKVMDAIKRFCDRIREALRTKGERGGHVELQVLTEDTAMLEDISKRFYAALDEAVERRDTGATPADVGERYSITINGDASESESKIVINEIERNIDKISEAEVFNVSDDTTVAEYSKKSEYVLKVFNEQGNEAYNSEIGIVELVKSGAKSTIAHGYGREKLAAIKAIKPVIENGTIISFVENYNGTGVDRYIVASKGKINGSNSYVGVVIKSYPNAKSNSKFYLHEAEIITADSSVMTAPQLSVDTVDKPANFTIPQTDTGSQDYSMQKSEKDSYERGSRMTSDEAAANEADKQKKKKKRSIADEVVTEAIQKRKQNQSEESGLKKSAIEAAIEAERQIKKGIFDDALLPEDFTDAQRIATYVQDTVMATVESDEKLSSLSDEKKTELIGRTAGYAMRQYKEYILLKMVLKNQKYAVQSPGSTRSAIFRRTVPVIRSGRKKLKICSCRSTSGIRKQVFASGTVLRQHGRSSTFVHAADHANSEQTRSCRGKC